MDSGIGSDITIDQLLVRYDREVVPKKKGRHWESQRVHAFRRYSVANVRLSEIRPADMVEWRELRLSEVSGSTVARELRIWSHVFTTARDEWNLIATNPLANVKKPKEPPARERLITDDEIDRICLGLGYLGGPPENTIQRIALIFLFAIETGMRQGEICGIRPEHRQGRVVHLPVTKNGDSRDVPLSSRAAEILDIVGNNFEAEADSVSELFRRYVRKLGIKNLTFHDTRHLAITRLSQKLNVLELAKMVGHKDIKMLMRYFDAPASETAKKLD